MYPILLSPIRLGSLSLPNRMVMGSMHLGFETAADGCERLAAFYAERAKGGIGLIVTGGVAPNPQGRFGADGPMLTGKAELPGHRRIAEAVHAAGGRILMQILHCGRYAKHADLVAPSPLRAPINSATPRELSHDEILATIDDYTRTALLAQQAGYDGIEVMASEGYLINEFLAPRTNQRTDAWGGSLDNRLRFATAIVAAIRHAVGPDFVVMVRMSMIDLVEDGGGADEVVAMARAMEAAGADALNSGIGWHEARVPTIAHAVPPGAWSWATGRVKAAVGIPVVASNRINTPEVAEAILARNEADLVAMARPLLADPAFAAKAASGQAERINVCIGCNQGCLDAMFSGQDASCLVNPRAGREGRFVAIPAASPRRIAVVGGGLAGMACAGEAAKRGHQVTLFEAADHLGGQFRLAERIAGKSEYMATIRYFAGELADVDVRLGCRADMATLAGFDDIVLATGVTPRRLDLPGADHAMVASYEDILSGHRQAGRRVAIMGSGGIAFDVALFLLHQEPFLAAWGIDRAFAAPGGLMAPPPPPPSDRRITMMQRRTTRPGAELGKTTGWILKATLQRQGVEMLSGVAYQRIDDAGLHLADRLVEADTVIVCIGQQPRTELAEALTRQGRPFHLIGGALRADRLDALRAIEEGTRLGLAL